MRTLLLLTLAIALLATCVSGQRSSGRRRRRRCPLTHAPLNSMCYKLVSGVDGTVEDAKKKCKATGGQLARFDTLSQFNLIQKNAIGIGDGTNSVIIDGEKMDGKWTFSTDLMENKEYWHPSQPDNYDRKGPQTCLAMAKGGLNDIHCSGRHFRHSYTKPLCELLSRKCGTDAACPHNYTLVDDTCFRLLNRPVGAVVDARAACSSLGGARLARFYSHDQWKFIYDMAENIGANDGIWLDGYTPRADKDRSKFRFTHSVLEQARYWKGGEYSGTPFKPDGPGNCLAMSPDGLIPIDCKATHETITHAQCMTIR